MSINLAPNHKMGLPVANPVLLAAGVIAYGDAVPKGLNPSALGAVLVGPVTQRGRSGAAPPRLAETTGGYVLATGLQNRGVAAVVRSFGHLWPRLGCPVLVQVADSHPAAAAAVARRLAGTEGPTRVEGIAGLELWLAPHADQALTWSLVDAVVRHSDLPLWVKLPLESAPYLALPAAEAGASALVIGEPLRGAGLVADPEGGPPLPVHGGVGGPLAFAPMLASLLQVAALKVPLPLIACGGIHTLAQARQALAAGAAALQIDSAAWIEPGLPARLAATLGRPASAQAQP